MGALLDKAGLDEIDVAPFETPMLLIAARGTVDGTIESCSRRASRVPFSKTRRPAQGHLPLTRAELRSPSTMIKAACVWAPRPGGNSTQA